MTATRVERKRASCSLKVVGFPERVALFVAAIHKPRAEELLTGFTADARNRASALVEDLKTADSAQRQARLAHEFGERHDSSERIQQLVVKTSGGLRAAIVASLPPTVRRQFPQFAGGIEAFPLAIRALAARLVKEATR